MRRLSESPAGKGISSNHSFKEIGLGQIVLSRIRDSVPVGLQMIAA